MLVMPLTGKRQVCLRDVKVQQVIALLSTVLSESGTTALDLNAAASLLLDVLDVLTAMAHDRRAQVESGDRL